MSFVDKTTDIIRSCNNYSEARAAAMLFEFLDDRLAAVRLRQVYSETAFDAFSFQPRSWRLDP
jgi:hypothetical protein